MSAANIWESQIAGTMSATHSKAVTGSISGTYILPDRKGA